ncbi:transcriptional regulator with XRE-family HTH domain [Arthrobacter sp. 2762]
MPTRTGPMQPPENQTREAQESPHDLDLGRRLRRIRRGKGFSLRQVSAEAGVSEGFLSQVERGKASPSVASLRRICQALGEPMGALFADPADTENGSPLVRVGDRRRILRPDGSAEFMLTPRDARKLQIHQTIVVPGRSSGPELYTHQGDEECIIVLEGTLTVRTGSREYFLESGDALLIDPQVGHGFANHGSQSAVVLWVITPANQDM